MSGTEPSDALRVSMECLNAHGILADGFGDQVVNALLTQLDKLKHRKNVLVMSTSNIAQAIGSSNRATPPLNNIAEKNTLPQTQHSSTEQISSNTSECRHPKRYTGS